MMTEERLIIPDEETVPETPRPTYLYVITLLAGFNVGLFVSTNYVILGLVTTLHTIFLNCVHLFNERQSNQISYVLLTYLSLAWVIEFLHFLYMTHDNTKTIVGIMSGCTIGCLQFIALQWPWDSVVRKVLLTVSYTIVTIVMFFSLL